MIVATFIMAAFLATLLFVFTMFEERRSDVTRALFGTRAQAGGSSLSRRRLRP